MFAATSTIQQTGLAGDHSPALSLILADMDRLGILDIVR
jgi:hypothetical protein